MNKYKTQQSNFSDKKQLTFADQKTDVGKHVKITSLRRYYFPYRFQDCFQICFHYFFQNFFRHWFQIFIQIFIQNFFRHWFKNCTRPCCRSRFSVGEKILFPVLMGVFFLTFFADCNLISSKNICLGQIRPPEQEKISDLDPQKIQTAIDGAIQFFRSRQKSNGSWDEWIGYEGGAPALCALALLSAGVPKDDPMIQKSLDYLRRLNLNSMRFTYVISLQTMVLALAEPERDAALIQRNVQWLESKQIKSDNFFDGGWSYVGLDASTVPDNSNSQFAVLALYEAEHAGATVQPETWQRAQGYWERMQNKDGSWGYKNFSSNPEGFPSGVGTGSMTCAGLGSLVMCCGSRGNEGAFVQGDQIHCCSGNSQNDLDERIQRGLDWLADHFSVQHNPNTAINNDTWLFYYLYGLERVGRLTANRFVGQHDWYREGTDYLLRTKGELTKYWTDPRQTNNDVTTSFALLFLAKGRWPVLVSKIKYNNLTGPDSWNEHPNDVGHLTQFVEKRWKQNLIWQVVDLKKATVDDLLQAPLIYFAGNVSPLPDDPEDAKTVAALLRGYLEQGGFILAEGLDNPDADNQNRKNQNADNQNGNPPIGNNQRTAGGASFDAGFRELMRLILPDDGNELTLLPADHPIWQAEVVIEPKEQRPLLGIEFGCRTSVVYISSPSLLAKSGESAPSVFDVKPSLSCLWEIARPLQRSETYPDSVQKQIDNGLGIGINIVAYATNRELKTKDLLAEELREGLGEESVRRGTLFAGILEHGGGASCAPRAIPKLMNWMKTELGLSVRTEVDRVRASGENLFEYPLLFMHGRNNFQWTNAERKNMRTFFDRGGFLFANSLCASKAFTAAFKTEMSKIFPDAVLEPIPADDPIFSAKYGGYKIEKLQIRRSQRTAGRRIQSVVSDSEPELLGIRKDDRWIVVFSPYDVSCALEKSGSVECAGYTQKSAFQLSVNIVLYAVEHLN